MSAVPAEAVHRGVDDALAVLDGSSRRRPGPSAGVLDTGDGPLDIRLCTRGAGDRCARLRRDSRDSLTDTLACAGHDRYLSIQLEVLQCIQVLL